MKVVAVGFTCIDIYEDLGGRCYATGNGIDVIINLAKRGIKGSVVSAVGDDDYGKLMIHTLSQYGIDISHLRIIPNKKTAVIKMSLKGKERVHGECLRGVMEDFRLEPADISFIQTHDIVHTDLSWDVKDQLPLMREKGAKIFFDFSIKYYHPAVPDVLRNITWGQFSFKKRTLEVEEFLKKSIAYGPEVLIATFGENGAIAYDGTQFYEQNAIKGIEIVNTVGAGDAFASGFLYGIISSLDIQSCLRLGAQTAAEILGKFEPY